MSILWSKSSTTTTFNGQHFKVKDAALLKNHLRTKIIPITIGVRQVKTMQIAAKYAHVWECSYLNPEQFALLNEKFEDICKKTNRNGERRITKNLSQKYLSTDDHKTGELHQSKVVLCLLFIPCEQFSEPVVP